VSVRFVNDMVRVWAATGGLVPKAQGNCGGHGKLSGLTGWVARRITTKRTLTAAGRAAEIAAAHGMVVHRGSVWRLLHNLGLTHSKKTCRPSSRSAPRSPPRATLDAPTLHGQNADAAWLYR
jgi:transposase